jgi:hypothetical protein
MSSIDFSTLVSVVQLSMAMARSLSLALLLPDGSRS